MAIRALRDLTSSVAKVADELGRMNNELDKAANTRFTSLPANFSPPLPLAPPGTPGNPFPSNPLTPITPTTILDSNGNPAQTNPAQTISSGEGGLGGSFKLIENPLVYPISGSRVLYKSDLEAYIKIGECQVYESPSGLKTISCPWGMYPSLDGGILSTVGASIGSGLSGGDGDIGGGSDFDRSGNQDRSRRLNPNVTNNPTGRQFGGSTTVSSTVTAPITVQIDSRPITDRLDGLRQDIRDLSRGDGGASIRLRNGI